MPVVEVVQVVSRSRAQLSPHWLGICEVSCSCNGGNGLQAIWHNLPVPECMRGVGRGGQRCCRAASLVGAVRDGTFIEYIAPVLGDDVSSRESAHVPPLYSLKQFAGDNAPFCNNIGRMRCLPEGSVVDWPAEARILQCEGPPGGHCLLGIGHWDKVPPSELTRVQSIRANQVK